VVTISFYLEILYCLRTLDIFVYHLMKTVEIFRLDMFGLDAYLVQPEENKKSRTVLDTCIPIASPGHWCPWNCIAFLTMDSVSV